MANPTLEQHDVLVALAERASRAREEPNCGRRRRTPPVDAAVWHQAGLVSLERAAGRSVFQDAVLSAACDDVKRTHWLGQRVADARALSDRCCMDCCAGASNANCETACSTEVRM